MNKPVILSCSKAKTTGAAVARLPCKPLFLFAPLPKITGALSHFIHANAHEKAPKKMEANGNAPLLIAEFLRNLTCGADLVNLTCYAASKMSVGQGRHTPFIRRIAQRHSRGATPLAGRTAREAQCLRYNFI